MKFKIAIIAIVNVILTSIDAWALLSFPKKTLVLQGKVLVHEGSIYLAINYKSHSESRIKLIGSLPNDIYTQHGSNAEVAFKILKPFMSYWGEAQFVELKRYLDPFEVPKVYEDERLLPTQ